MAILDNTGPSLQRSAPVILRAERRSTERLLPGGKVLPKDKEDKKMLSRECLDAAPKLTNQTTQSSGRE